MQSILLKYQRELCIYDVAIIACISFADTNMSLLL